jgi:hypothetical protein
MFDFRRAGIKKGSMILSSITGESAVVHDNKRVLFRGNVVSLTGGATKILRESGRNWKAVQGTRFWLYDRQRLDKITQKHQA